MAARQKTIVRFTFIQHLENQVTYRTYVSRLNSISQPKIRREKVQSRLQARIAGTALRSVAERHFPASTDGITVCRRNQTTTHSIRTHFIDDVSAFDRIHTDRSVSIGHLKHNGISKSEILFGRLVRREPPDGRILVEHGKSAGVFFFVIGESNREASGADGGITGHERPGATRESSTQRRIRDLHRVVIAAGDEGKGQ